MKGKLSVLILTLALFAGFAAAAPTHTVTATLNYDFTGPEEKGLSRAERRQLLEAA